MNPLNATFEDYQAQYATVLPVGMRKGLTYLQMKVHSVVSALNKAIQVPDAMLKTAQLSIAILSFLSFNSPDLVLPRQICKDGRNLMNACKGLNSIDGFLNFQFSWRLITINVSGMTFLVISILNLIERVDCARVSAIKVSLKVIPIFGILPYGGLLPFSVVGLTGITALFGLEKRNVLIKEETRIKNEKFVYWSQPIELDKVQQRQAIYQARILNLRAEIAAYDQLIEEGELLQDQFHEPLDQTRRIYACQKALKELGAAQAKKKAELASSEKKALQWSALEKNWTLIDSKELEEFRKAKYAKWATKLDKIECEKRDNLIGIAINLLTLSRQALVIFSVAMGYGILILPVALNLGLDLTIAGGGLAIFLMKRSIKKIQISSVDLEKHVKFYQP